MGSQMRSPKPPTSTATTEPMVKKKLEKIISMNGGDGECSYNRMSVVQEYALHGLQPFFSEAVHQMTLPHQPQHQNDQNQLHEGIPCLRLADFGSSTGRNAFLYMEFLVSRIRQEYKHRNLHMPEVQVFFNDLPGNDFNSMFGLLPPIKHEDGESGRIRDYFAAGVPGSFYGRLFPKESLHFAVSLHCLHWISQVHSNSILIFYHHHIPEPSALTFASTVFFQCTTFEATDMHCGVDCEKSVLCTMWWLNWRLCDCGLRR